MINNNLNDLEPSFKERVILFLDTARAQGLDVYVFEGRRSKERQYELFGKGRSAVTLKKYGVPISYARPKEKQVTWTLQSKHLTGKAVDIVFDANKDPKVRVPTWNGNYAKLIKIAPAFGLRSLSPYETCHFEEM